MDDLKVISFWFYAIPVSRRRYHLEKRPDIPPVVRHRLSDPGRGYRAESSARLAWPGSAGECLLRHHRGHSEPLADRSVSEQREYRENGHAPSGSDTAPLRYIERHPPPPYSHIRGAT